MIYIDKFDKLVERYKNGSLDELWEIAYRPQHYPEFNWACEFSPAKVQFQRVNQCKQAGKWSHQYFMEEEVPFFYRVLSHRHIWVMRTIKKLSIKSHEGKSIGFGCTCALEEKECYCSVIIGILQGMGLEVETSTGADYSAFFTDYMNYYEEHKSELFVDEEFAISPPAKRWEG